MWKRATLVAAAGLAAMASGCAEEREPINQVQPNVLDKSFFVGKDLQDSSDDPEFYAQGTLIDVGYGASQDGLFTSTYAQPLSRIKWVIQEKELVARLTYERIENSDGKGVGSLKNEGVIVAVYPIEKHFDIQKQYNPTTGEELNVIVENSTDRPWYEREYFRVDWSKNLNTDSYDFDTLSQMGIYGGIKYEPLDYYINDPNHPDAPHFDLENGYFDVTNKAFAVPGKVDLSHLGWGIKEFPSCFLPADFAGGTAPAGNCNPVELTIRQAFRRIDKRDYEPKNWDGYRFQAFGAFYTERFGYDRMYGMTDARWHRLINRYDIWERNHFYADPVAMTGAVECYTPHTTPPGEDPNRDRTGRPKIGEDGQPEKNENGEIVEIPDGTADECAAVTAMTGVPGSQCDTFTQKCTLPYAKREPRTLAWYYTSGSNYAPEYWDSTMWATHEWDVALRAAIQAARYAECVATGQTDCAAKFPVWDGQQDDNQDAIDLAREVDDCRNGRAYPGENCDALAEQLGEQREVHPAVIALAKMPEMVVLCHSPVEADDHPACGGPRLPEGLTAATCADAEENGEYIPECYQALRVRRGDLRFHQINVIKQPQTPSPWGIMTDAIDPLTGESISASINVWSHVGDSASQGVVDIARYIAGELETSDITEGKYIHEWSQAAQAATRGGSLPPMSKYELDRRIASFAGVPTEQLPQLRSLIENLPASAKASLEKTRHELTGIRADLKAASQNAATYAARRQRAIDSGLEAELTTKAMQELMGIDELGSAQALLPFASPLRGANPGLMRELRNLRELALAERGTCVLNEAPAPVSYADLAKVLQAKFGNFDRSQSTGEKLARAEKMRKYVAAKMNYAVIAHEMGHSIGLRHNFVSSSDAWGYRPQYWQLRTKNGTQTAECVDRDGNMQFDPTGECVGPRYVDPITDEERDNLLWMFMHSTVMDYPGEYTQDMIGLGAYDFAAARAFYGDVVAVHADPSYNAKTNRGTGMLAKADNFGGITGFSPSIGAPTSQNPVATRSFHYSQYNKEYELIKNCRPIDEMSRKPASWNEELWGAWHPTLDGLLVAVDGQYTVCEQQKVDYVPWRDLRMPATSDNTTDPRERDVNFSRSGPAIDSKNRTRVPYGFATDRWADLGNLSVYRHDNGADAYELFDFLITQQEINHIFDNYRRGRATFSVRGAAFRTLTRYNEKLRDAAKGLGLMKNIYTDFALELGYDAGMFWPLIAENSFRETILASGLAFDHFTRQLQRPEPGKHFRPATSGFFAQPLEDVLRSDQDTLSEPGPTVVTIPNGATGKFGVVQYGGKPIENALASNQGEYDSEYTINAGSYYDKAFTAMLMTESYDNFISDSRRDFTDARYRAVSLADLFPDGFRRWLANNLTVDDEIRGVRVVGQLTSRAPFAEVETDSEGYPAFGIGWTNWWANEGPQTCFAEDMSLLCSNNTASTVVLDPQIGWEQQKFLIAWTLLYLPENQKQTWLNQLWLWELGADSDPGFQNRIEFHDPNGRVYIAKTFGKEDVFGKTVHRGIAARVLEQANELLAEAYVTDPVDNDGNGTIDWYVPVLGPHGEPMVKWDPTISQITPDGMLASGRDGCNSTDNSDCKCTENRACMKLQDYTQVPYFLREAIGAYGLGHPSMKGLY